MSLDKEQTIDFKIDGFNAKSVSGRILTAKNVSDYNNFDNPDNVKPTAYKGAEMKKGVVTVKVPAKSIVVLNIK